MRNPFIDTHFGALFVLCGLLGGPLSADAQETEAGAAAKQRQPATAAAREAESTPADDDLFKRLSGIEPSAKPSRGDLLEQAISGMRQAQKRIDSRDAGTETREVQTKVVESLEELIRQLQQQAQASASSASSAKPSDDGTNQQDTESPMPADSNASDDGSSTGDEKSPDSTDETRKAEDRQAAPLTKNSMERDVWGHLPPAMRQKLLNAYNDKYLENYSDIIRRYFDALAEEGREQKSGNGGRRSGSAF